MTKTKITIAVIVALTVVVVAYIFRGQIIVATVNSQPIFRWEVIGELEKQGGSQIIESFISKRLILQEAEKQNLAVSQEEIDAEIAKIEASLAGSGQTLDQAIAAQGLTREDLVEEIKLQKIAEALAGQGIEVTDEEINEYLESNGETATESTESAQLKESVREGLRQQKLSQAIQTWLQSLRDSASINYPTAKP